MSKLPRTALGLGLASIGLLTLVVGLVSGGGPGYAHKEKRDQQRSEALSDLGNEIGRFFVSNNRLPESAEYILLVDNTWWSRERFRATPIWPELVSAYKKTGTETYELCASFETDTRQQQQNYGIPGANDQFPNFWNHPDTYTCIPAQISTYLSTEAAERRARIASSTQP